MDFLTTALYALDEEQREKLVGALLTRFEPADITYRARVIYASVDCLKTGEGLFPSGFSLDSNGILMSDTQSRRAMNENLTLYVGNEVTDTAATPPLSLIDIVLYGAKYGAYVVQNFGEMSKDPTGVEPILISMANFKVSNSSFNIYAAYKNVEGFFRTFSLMDVTTDNNYPFVIAVPDEQVENYTPVSKLLQELPEVEFLSGFHLYRVDTPFQPFYTFTGEAFCNYLAYNVAYYKMGLKVIKDFLVDTKYVAEREGDLEAPRSQKVPLHNVSIECGYKIPQTHAVLAAMQDSLKLRELISNDTEAYITLVWLQNIFRVADTIDCASNEERLAAASANLQYDCKLQLLHYACELLAQRFYLCQLGPFEDTLGPVLRGGGVNGSSIKRVTG